MRLAVYNVENLFERARAMNQSDWRQGQEPLKQFADLSTLLGQATYTPEIKVQIIALLSSLGLDRTDRGKFVVLRRNRGELLKRRKAGGIDIVAGGRSDWVGFLELIQEPINHESMLMTARVFRDVNADIFGVVEAENRPALKEFSDKIVTSVSGISYDNVMLIDGNDARGIDVGIYYRREVSLDFIRSHVSDRDANGRTIFSRDCAEYQFATASGQRLLVMVNHFKSKSGAPSSCDARRKAQANRVREIYEQRLSEGIEHIAVIGDLNDAPKNSPLEPLITGTTLKDISVHPSFNDGGYPGTFELCNAANKIDYILLSPKLFDRVRGGGVFRKAMWPGERPKRWETYPELKQKVHAGSDHACLFADLQI